MVQKLLPRNCYSKFRKILAIVEIEQPKGVIIQFGGQTPLKLARDLEAAGVQIIGTSPDAIDMAEDRERFQQMLHHLGLKQPANRIVRHIPEKPPGPKRQLESEVDKANTPDFKLHLLQLTENQSKQTHAMLQQQVEQNELLLARTPEYSGLNESILNLLMPRQQMPTGYQQVK